MPRILGKIFNKIGVSDSNKCLVLNSISKETLINLFFICQESHQLWQQLPNKIVNMSRYFIKWMHVLVGYLYNNPYKDKS